MEVKPPDGFIINAPQASEAPPPPDGFVIDKQPVRDKTLSWRQGQAPTMWEKFSDMFGDDAHAQSQKATNSLTYSQMFNISPSQAYDLHDEISAQVKDKLATEKIVTETKGIKGAASSGVDTSLFGMMARQKPAVPFESASQAERWVNGLVGMGVDLPFFMAGYAIGGGNPVSGTAGAFGFTAGLRQVLMDRYTKGEVKSASELFDRTGNALKETIKGEVVGGFMGGAGYMAPVWLQKLAPGATPSVGWKAATELATMTAAGKLIEGHLPTAQDLVDNTAILLMMHAGIKGVENAKERIPEVRAKLQAAYVETGVHPKELQNIIASEPVNPKEDIIQTIDRVVADVKKDLPPEPVEKPKEENKAEQPTAKPNIVEPAATSQGENITAYHGSPDNFSQFEFGKKAENRGGSSFGYGINITEDIGHAKVYSGKDGYLYEVNIPKEELNNFITWEKKVPNNISYEVPKIDTTKPIPFGGGATVEYIGNQWKLKSGDSAFSLSQKEIDRMFGDKNTGEQIYRRLVASLGDEKAASEWLLSRGVKGITNNTERNVRNYTIFEPSIIKTNKTAAPEVGQAAGEQSRTVNLGQKGAVIKADRPSGETVTEPYDKTTVTEDGIQYVETSTGNWANKPDTSKPKQAEQANGETTSIKNKAVDVEREAMGLPKIETPIGERPSNWRELVEGKVNRGEINPEDMVRKINNLVEIGEKPPVINDEGNHALLYGKKMLQSEHARIEKQIEEAKKEDQDTTVLEKQRDEIEIKIDENQKATKAIGTEQSRALSSRQDTMEGDYSYSGLIQRAKEDGMNITPEVRQQLKDLSEKVEKLQSELDGITSQRTQTNIEKTIKQIKNEEGLKQRKQKRTVKKEELDIEFDNLISAFAKEHGAELGANAFVDPARYKFLIDLARNRIQKGIVKAEDIVDTIHTALKNAGIEMSKRDIQDTISQYGVLKEMSKDEIDVSLREAKRQMQLLSALEDAKSGKSPEKSGLQRGEESERVRELTRQVQEAMKESGLDSKSTRSPEEQWKTSLDAVKTRLVNRITDLSKQIDTGEKTPKKTGVAYDAEANALKEFRDGLQKIVTDIEGKPEMSPEQKVKMATAAVEKSITEYERRIKEKDLNPQKKESATPETPELKALRDKRDALKEIYKAMQDEASPKKSPEQQKIDAFMKLKERQIAEYERRLKEGDFSKTAKPEPRTLSDKELKIQYELDKLKQEYEKARMDNMLSQRDAATIAKDSVFEALNLIKAIKSSYDISAPGRQGLFFILSHPIQGFKNLPEMFRALKSDEAAFRIQKEISERPNFKNGNYKTGNVSITEVGGIGSKAEEMYRSRWAQAVPGIPASERAFVSFLNLSRADLFDSMHEYAFEGRKATKEELQALGDYVNQATGRGTIKGYENALQGLGSFLWAPKLVLSRFQMILGKGLLPGGGRTAATRKAVAREYARILGSLATIYAVNSIINDKELETDPTSSDFGKIVIGNTRIDPLGGVAQVTVFMGRLAFGETKSINTGQIKDIRGDNVPYGGTTTFDVIANFMRTKLTPALGLGINLLGGKDLIGNKVELSDIPAETAVPLAISDIYQAMNEEGVPAGAALGILGLFGVGIQTHEQKGASR